jgi:O-antigen/teichoic acid export membrane protein
MFEQLRRLARHSAAYSVGSAISKAFAFIIVPLYTRELVQGDYGAYVLLNAGAAVLAVFYELGVSSSVMRFYYDYDDERERRRYIGSMWLVLTGVTVTVSLLLTLFGEPLLQPLFHGVAFWPYVVLTIWGTCLSTANVIPWVLMRIREQSTRFVLLVAAQAGVLLAAAITFVIVLHMGLLGAVLALFVQGAVVFVFFTAYTLRNASLRVRWSYLPPSLRYGLPVLLLQCGWWVLDASDRFILRAYTSLAIVAVYSVGYAIGRILIMFSQAINQAWTPFFFQTVKEDRPDAKEIFSYTATYFALVVCAMGGFIVVFTREAVLFFGGHTYLAAAHVTPLVVLGAVAQSMFYVPSRGLFLQKKTHWLPLILLVGTVVNLGLNFALIPVLGMMGAAWATLAGYSATVAVTYLVSQRYYEVHYQVGRLVRILLVLVAVTVAATFYEPGGIGLIVLWKLVLLAAAPLALVLTGFFEPRERRAIRRLLRGGGRRLLLVTGRGAGATR